MHVLFVRNAAELAEGSRPFANRMEPLLKQLELAGAQCHTVACSQIAKDYLAVCRWPFRQLEYSYVLDAITAAGVRGGSALDAGSGVTPFAHALAGMGFRAKACDHDRSLIEALAGSRMEQVYGTTVAYEWQDLTALTYEDASFDLVTCVSVLEHIGAPADQAALRQLLRVLKPGGHLVFTLDYEPPAATPTLGGRNTRRFIELLRQGNLSGILRSATRKARAYWQVRDGSARLARTTDQPFTLEHLQQDLLPILERGDRSLPVSYGVGPDAVHLEDVPGFWNLISGLFELQGRRMVLPAAFWYQKPRSGAAWRPRSATICRYKAAISWR